MSVYLSVQTSDTSPETQGRVVTVSARVAEVFSRTSWCMPSAHRLKLSEGSWVQDNHVWAAEECPCTCRYRLATHHPKPSDGSGLPICESCWCRLATHHLTRQLCLSCRRMFLYLSVQTSGSLPETQRRVRTAGHVRVAEGFSRTCWRKAPPAFLRHVLGHPQERSDVPFQAKLAGFSVSHVRVPLRSRHVRAEGERVRLGAWFSPGQNGGIVWDIQTSSGLQAFPASPAEHNRPVAEDASVGTSSYDEQQQRPGVAAPAVR